MDKCGRLTHIHGGVITPVKNSLKCYLNVCCVQSDEFVSRSTNSYIVLDVLDISLLEVDLPRV